MRLDKWEENLLMDTVENWIAEFDASSVDAVVAEAIENEVQSFGFLYGALVYALQSAHRMDLVEQLEEAQ